MSKDPSSVEVKIDLLLEAVKDQKKETKEQLEKLDSKIEALEKEVAKQDKTLARNTDSLEHHIKMTNINTDRIIELEKQAYGVKMSYKTVLVIASLLGATIGLAIKIFTS